MARVNLLARSDRSDEKQQSGRLIPLMRDDQASPLGRLRCPLGTTGRGLAWRRRRFRKSRGAEAVDGAPSFRGAGGATAALVVAAGEGAIVLSRAERHPGRGSRSPPSSKT